MVAGTHIQIWLARLLPVTDRTHQQFGHRLKGALVINTHPISVLAGWGTMTVSVDGGVLIELDRCHTHIGAWTQGVPRSQLVGGVDSTAIAGGKPRWAVDRKVRHGTRLRNSSTCEQGQHRLCMICKKVSLHVVLLLLAANVALFGSFLNHA
eukprot:6204002-Amphidinium_carterae.2